MNGLTFIISLDKCEYDKKRKVLKLASEYCGMPEKLIVRSHITGREIRFDVIGTDDILFDQDGWDGEQQIYRPVETIPNVDYLVIYNQY